MNYNKEFIKTPDGTPIGVTFNISLEGQVVKVQTGNTGIISVADGMAQIRAAFNQDGQIFKVSCEDTVFFSGLARVNKIDFQKSNDNWVFTAPYTIELEMDVEGSGEDSGLIPPYIADFSEEWSVEFIEDKAPFYWTINEGATVDANSYQFRVTHNVSAKGKTAYSVSGLIKPSWQQARDYVLPKLGYDGTILTQSGLFNVGANYTAFNHIRSNQISETDGSYTVAESWLVINPTGTGVPGKALEDFTITSRTSIENGLTNVSIEGNIQGLEERSYTGILTTTSSKYSNASGYWSVVRPRIYYRAKQIAQSIALRPLNISPVSTTIGHSLSNGTISYAYEYNDRPSVCITGALQEVIQISDSYPVDVFASLVVLGRAAGPILQQISTVTAPTRQLVVDVIMQPPTGCIRSSVQSFLAQRPYSAVNDIVVAVEEDLEGSYGQVFKQSDSDQWDASIGKYNRTVTWTYMNCS
jgi:predicted secreted protein